jgi:hypothetical protein
MFTRYTTRTIPKLPTRTAPAPLTGDAGGSYGYGVAHIFPARRGFRPVLDPYTPISDPYVSQTLVIHRCATDLHICVTT